MGVKISILASITSANDIVVSDLDFDNYIYLLENGTNSASFTVRLKSKPANTINVAIAVATGYCEVNKTNLNFTTSNYSNPQEVVVIGLTSSVEGVKYDTINITATGCPSKALTVRTVDTNIESSIYNTEPLSLINWDNESDLNNLRSDTIDWIWGTGYGNNDGTLPITNITNITNFASFTGDTYFDLTGITGYSNCERGSITMGSGSDWTVYFYKLMSSTNNGSWFILPSGHGDDWAGPGDANGYEDLINSLLSEGYNIIFFYMVGRGPNSTQSGITQGSGGYGGTHDQMAMLESSSPYFNPLEYFLTPSVAAINYAENQSATHIYMTGISGGGWTTALIQALDERVEKGFNVSGNYPIFILQAYEVISSDYEQGYNATGDTARTTQFLIDQYNRCGYMDLYCISAQNREHYQYNNINDSCCFMGYYNTVYSTELVNKLGNIGTFKAILYNNSGNHAYNSTVINDIISKL